MDPEIRRITDPKIDDEIRKTLRDFDAKGQLPTISAVVGPPVSALREIMNSTGELSIMDRGMLALHLRCGL